MKNLYLIILVWFCFAITAKSQSQIFAVDVAIENQYVRDSVHVIGRLDLEFPVPGKVIVTFDGEGSGSPNDRILVAANREPKWEVNHGHASFMSAIQGERHCFSHTRNFDVPAGQHSFYAVTHNFADAEGDGIATVYGTLYVEFIPQSSVVVSNSSYVIKQFDASDPVAFDSVTIQATGPGKIEVRINGNMAGYEKDIFMVAVSDTKDWNYTDPYSIPVENNNPFSPSLPVSDTRVFDIPGAGIYTYYAMAHRGIEVEGSGLLWAFTSMNARFYPLTSGVDIVSERFAGQNLQLDATTTILDSIKLDIPVAGDIEIRFDGALISPLGNNILIAVNNAPSYTLQNGSVILQTTNEDLDRHPVNHTMIRSVEAGLHTFYLMAENYQGPGTTTVDLFGEFLVKYYGEPIVSANDEFAILPFEVWPNPAKDQVAIHYENANIFLDATIFDSQGRCVMQSKNIMTGDEINVSSLPSGIYMLQVNNGKEIGIKKLVKE